MVGDRESGSDVPIINNPPEKIITDPNSGDDSKNNGTDEHPELSTQSPMPDMAEWDHSLPLSFGLMLRHNLTDRWGIEAGITYSYLASRQIISAVEKRQQLHYLGIPVAVTYTPLRTGSFDFYLRAGGAADFNIAGRTSLTVDSATPQFMHFAQKGIQWSVSANLGIMYNITPVVGFYLEPGVSHYFPLSNQPVSYWKEHPTNFNFRVGIRTNF
jgi:hypothetical protein